MKHQSFLIGSREMWFSFLQFSFTWLNWDPIISEVMYKYSDFLIKNMILGHPAFMIQSTWIFL